MLNNKPFTAILLSLIVDELSFLIEIINCDKAKNRDNQSAKLPKVGTIKNNKSYYYV